MSAFEYNDYKKWVNDWIKNQEKGGYGLYSRFADLLGTSSAAISQIFKGDRDLNLEQATKISQVMSLNTLETDYFLLLLQKERAGTHDLKSICDRQLAEIRSRGRAIKNRIQHSQLTDQDKALFYSNWTYIATWLAAPIPEFNTISKLSKHFQIPEDTIAEILRFLLDRGILIKKPTGFDFGKNVIHVPHDSPYVLKHHMNWRMKALQSIDRRRNTDLHYTAPMSLSSELAAKIREEIVQFIQKQTKTVASSASERLMCLNIDWFEY